MGNEKNNISVIYSFKLVSILTLSVLDCQCLVYHFCSVENFSDGREPILGEGINFNVYLSRFSVRSNVLSFENGHFNSVVGSRVIRISIVVSDAKDELLSWLESFHDWTRLRHVRTITTPGTIIKARWHRFCTLKCNVEQVLEMSLQIRIISCERRIAMKLCS